MNNIQKRERDIFIITFHMIPFTKQWGASQRMFILARDLIEHGYNINIFHANFGFKKEFNQKINFKSYPIDIKPQFIQKYLEQRDGKKIKAKQILFRKYFSKLFSSIFWSINRIFERFIFQDWRFGLISVFWVLSAKKEFIFNLKKKMPKAIIISGPFFMLFLMSVFIKKHLPETKIILDYRDPWSLLNKKYFTFSWFIERYFLRQADHITVFSEEFKNDLVLNFKIPQTKVTTIYNGYDQELWDKIINNRKKQLNNNKALKIVYAASNIYIKDGYRNVQKILNALVEIGEPNNFSIQLVGNLEKSDFIEYIQDKNINITFSEGFVSQYEANKILYKSDVSIILASDEKPSLYTLTGKLFNSIRAKIALIGISQDQNIAFVKFIEAHNIGKCCKYDTNQIIKLFRDFFNLKLQNRLIEFMPSENIIQMFSRKNQNKNFIEIIEDK